MSDGLTLPPHLARPVVEAAAAPYPATVIRPLLEPFGFGGLTYLVGHDDGQGAAGRIAWSTHAPAWTALDRPAGHRAIDPRLTHTRRRVTPCLRDAGGLRGDPRLRDLFRHAAACSICSGVIVPVHDGRTGQVALAFDSGRSPVPDVLRRCIAESLGDQMLVAVARHECALSWCIPQAVQHATRAPALTRRERECLALAARGVTNVDIGNKLSLTERTIIFHFGNLRWKLGVLNRPKAIATGTVMGLVTQD